MTSPSLIPAALLGERRDDAPARLLEADCLRFLIVDRPDRHADVPAADAAVLDDILRDIAREVNGYREPVPLISPVGCCDRRVDADNFAAQIDERRAAGPRVGRGASPGQDLRS